MKQATQTIYQALMSQNETTRLNQLQEGIAHGEESFRQWGLMSLSLDTYITQLKKESAVAVKPTGSGNGGYVLSLWKSPPPPHLGLQPLSL